jgi:2-(1,2-epoxy-1,2-dihydrophenyl)acetyl-CoA isomerase
VVESVVSRSAGLNTTLDGSVAWLELTRPDRLNALNDELVDDLLAALTRFESDPGVGCVVLTGAGRAFCAGADILTQFTTEEPPDLGELLAQGVNRLILLMREMSTPLVAAVNGAAAGVGCSLALACDVIVAAESSFFAMSFLRLGLSVDGGASMTLAARVGLGRAVRMTMLQERVTAPIAYEWGLVDRIAEDASLRHDAQDLASELAAGPSAALGSLKRVLAQGALLGLEAQLAYEAKTQSDLGRTRDFQEGVQAFIDKRAPNFAPATTTRH